MEKLLTISIPAYNISKFIDRIMSTILSSKYKDALEVLIVNDGSTDNTLELAQKYQKAEPSVIKIIDKKNGGHGSTINAGIEKATGRYFKVIDGDDWVDTNALDYMINELINLNIMDDILVCDYTFVDENCEVIEKINNLEQNHISDKFSYNSTYPVEKICSSGTFPFPFHSLYYRTDLMKKSRKIDENCFYVDIEYALYPFEYAQTIRFINANVYMYLIGREGQSISPENYYKNKSNLETVLFSLLDFYQSESVSTKLKLYILRRIQALYSDIVNVYLYIGNKNEANNWFIPIEKKTKEVSLQFYNSMKSNTILKFIRAMHYCGYRFFSFYKAKK